MRDYWILDSKVTSMTQDELFREIDQIVTSAKTEVIGNTNVHGMYIEMSQPWLREWRNGLRINHIDGAGICIGAKLLGLEIADRVCINDFFWPMVDHAIEKGYSLYMLGADPTTQKMAANVVSERAPKLKLVGAQHGYFDKEDGPENDAVIAAINAAAPDILLVGFGMPIQERWVKNNSHRLNARVIMVVGGFFDRLSGRVPWAPAWMTNNGLEWLYLSLHRPKRFFTRYAIENPAFLCRILLERVRNGRHNEASESRRTV